MAVFHNGNEFAEKLTITIDGKDYTGMFVVEVDDTKGRAKPSSDHIESLDTKRLTLFVPLETIGKVPRKGSEVLFLEDYYEIVMVEEEMGEVILTLEGVIE